MKSLRSAAKADQARATVEAVTLLFAEAKEAISQYPHTIDEESGTVTVDAVTFTVVDRSLRVVMPCPRCRMDVPSTPIRRFSDIASQLDGFRPSKHDCMDVD